MKRYLVFQDGTVIEGEGFGHDGESYGELVFTTSMTGYLESITDPSYRNQILVFASPTIGNYDISMGSEESGQGQVAGIVTRDAHSVLRSDSSWDHFQEYLRAKGVPGIDLVDTRQLVRKIREGGTLRCHMSNSPSTARAFPDPMDADLVSLVTCRTQYHVPGRNGHSILFVDLGAKRSLVREMSAVGSLLVVPYDADLEMMAGEYDAVFLSNGPGDPSHPSLSGVVDFVRRASESMPVYGVCLGHQIISQAFGGRTTKMKFGHRGSNHAVGDGTHVMITTHNHGYAVDEASLAGTPLQVIQRDINDGTVEKIKHRDLHVFSVQYHPEASPGPHDARVFFQEILADMEALQ